ncbi:hypothetical protein ARALYDRAFT_492473 [Arabidopsis lyrata subsp. lyrata]|uniref:Uncharacterized protein n=1 Tax=Arabidopsis lyrata subsp. lyrata TaxID=81972 RepID=D7M8Z9_ARALL|nr:uncharacterized protein LOC9305826 [Arabidopsis lyrata subsp. lyrata]EFH46014.1 hypothetical protein ARALYDRAFT_492473 [Arabidopsis lyrata subsp. lyrata]|eukprot:XP_020873761.1 uncharacterized protein LOC9305826 [Arabidopsis lyrata subsp. lyrata]
METETPLIAETIALTEKKVAMALDDIIKLAKRKTNVNKGKKPRRGKNKNQNFNGAARNNTSNVRHHISAVRQGSVGKRRSRFQGNQFPVTTNIARKAATAAPLDARGRAFNGGRMTSAYQSRRIAPPVQNISVQPRVNAKRQEVDEKVEHRGWKRKTLDSRFASMKEQRMTINNYGVTVQVPRLPPWARARRFFH